MIRTPLVALSLVLALAPPTRAQDPRSVEVAEFSHRVDFSNQPVRNRFVIVKRGERFLHPVLATSSAQRFLRELHLRSDLEEAVLNGQEIPVELIKAQAPGLFGQDSTTLEVESFDLETPSFDDLRAVQRALTQQYADNVLLETLGRLCERDWARIRKHAAGASTFDSWTVPSLYAALTFAEDPPLDGTRTLRISGTALGPDVGTGRRELRGFLFTGVLEVASGRFVHVEVKGAVYNTVKQIEQKLTYTRRLVRTEAVAAELAREYDAAAAELARAVRLASCGEPRKAVAAYDALLARGALGRFAAPGAAYFGEVRPAAQGIAWEHTALQPGLDAARASGKPLLVLFDQDNCPSCALLERMVLNKPAFVRAVQDAFVTVNLNACTDVEVAKRYGLRGTPTLLILDSDGVILGRQAGVRPLAAGLALLKRVAALAQPQAKKYF